MTSVNPMHDTDQHHNSEPVRDQILDSAIKIFAKSGFGGARLRQIADHAGVNHAMIKYYFGSKDNLWRDAVSYLFGRQSDELAARLDGANTQDKRQLFLITIDAMIRYNARHPEHARLIMQATMTPGPHLDWVMDQMRTYQTKQLGPIFGGALQGTPSLKSISLRYFIYGAINTVFTLEHEARQLYNVETTSEDFVDFYAAFAIEQLTPAIDATLHELADRPAETGETPGEAGAAVRPPSMTTRQTDQGLEVRILIPEQ